MRCNIVLHEGNKNGIIGKMADRLFEESLKLGVDVSLSDHPMDNVDVNHFMLFSAACPSRQTRNSMMITHLYDARIFHLTKDLVKTVDIGICMSRMTEKKLADYGIPSESLCHILPGHDGDVLPRRIKIGLTTHLYDDGRKRENMLVRLGEEIGLHDFQFEIFGLRWNKIAERLRACGAIVNIYEGGTDYQEDYKQLLEAIPHFDYYLYTGLDEGSMGTLDALSAGVPTIVTKEGFHMDLGVEIDYPFITYEELKSAFLQISSQRNKRIQSVRRLTWEEYAKQHIIVWENLIKGNKASIKQKLNQSKIKNEVIDGYNGTTFLDKILYLSRIFQHDRWPCAKEYYKNKFFGPYFSVYRKIKKKLFLK
jgi:hypothetical protein